VRRYFGVPGAALSTQALSDLKYIEACKVLVDISGLQRVGYAPRSRGVGEISLFVYLLEVGRCKHGRNSSFLLVSFENSQLASL
jgi:hypothetical protein